MTGHPPDRPGDWPPMPDYPSRGEYPTTADYSPQGYPPMPDDALVPGYPPGPDYPPMPDYPPGPNYPSVPGYPQRAGLPADGTSSATADGPEWSPDDPAVAHDEYTHPPAGYHAHTGDQAGLGDFRRAGGGHDGPGHSGHGDSAAGNDDTGPSAGPTASAQVGGEEARRIVLAYLTVPFFAFLPALAIYLQSFRRSRWSRVHAAQAVNVAVTSILYDVSGVIMGAMLALDTPLAGVLTMAPLAAVLWLITLAHLVRAARAAARREEYTFPRWLCTPVIR